MEKRELASGHTTFISEEDKCPFCGYIINAATSPTGDQPPEPGDVSICFKCTSYVVFDDNLKLRCMTDDELLELPNETLSMLTEQRTKIRRFQQWFDAMSQEAE